MASALGSAPAAAWDCCNCYPGYGSYGYAPYGCGAYVAVARVYAYEPRVPYDRFDPRWQYSAAYYNPPPGPIYGYAYVDRGPAYLVQPAWPRDRRW
jgi:hypothetical protein